MYQLLIVDDQPDLVEDLSTNLPWKSINISTVYRAYSAAEALNILKVHPIDIVITDIRMPGLSGLDLIEMIRSSWVDVKCILLSGYNDFEYAQRAIQQQATDYLLKPVDDDELISTVRRAIDELETRWLEVSSHQQAMTSIKNNLPVLQSHLLESLLLQEKIDSEQLAEQLNMLELPIAVDSPFYMMLLRMEDYFYEQSENDHSLLQYAICNIAEHLFLDDYQLWYIKDRYDYYVFLILPKQASSDHSDMHIMNAEVIERKAAHLQHYVKLYLKGTISIVISEQGSFPMNVHTMYDELLRSIRHRIGEERDFLLTVYQSNEKNEEEANSLHHLYAPPLLNHLLETGQWEAIEEKLLCIYKELEQQRDDSYEYILEAYFAIISALSYAVHKNRLHLSDVLGTEFNSLLNTPHFHTIAQLKSWVTDSIAAFKHSLSSRNQHSKTNIIQQVQRFIALNLEDASLQSIAEHVYLNPSYLSKLYKLETGEGISDYLSRLKLETAAHLLRTSNDKIYEIAAKVGYTKTSYFIKVFKNSYQLTPQEFRDQHH